MTSQCGRKRCSGDSLRQRGYNQGRYVIDAARNEWSEHALHHFHRRYLKHMAVRAGDS